MTRFLLVASLFIGCAPPPPAEVPKTPPADEPELDTEGHEAVSEAMETGKDCAKAEVLCEGGVCTASIKNDCEAPVTCELDILAICQGETDTGEARGKGRDTIAPGVAFNLQAGADCHGDAVLATQVDTLTCE